MEKTHLDPTRAAPPRPPGEPNSGTASAATDTRTGSSRTPIDPTAGSPPADAFELRTLGDYRILRRLGEGGMGAVYLSYDGRNDRQVALKVLNDAFSSNQNYIDRFYREAKSGKLLNHPSIVRTFDVGQDRQSQMHYLVLEYVDGPSAHALMQLHGRLAVGDAVHVALDVARALEHAHSRNIVHRDIKPDNILLTRSGIAKLGDLGLAKRTDEASHLTQAHQGFGTTAYMPYEQAINAKSVDGRSDIYALGATLYHLLTGQVPFLGENHLEIVEKKKQGYYRLASTLNPEVTPALDVILGRMLARHVRDRYQTASELIIDLERSRLSVPVPSFADPDLASKDPWIQACLTTGEPTRMDPDGGSTSQRNGVKEDEWIVHYKNRAGRPFATRLTTEHVVERLQEGTLPANAEARRPSDERLQPLSAYAEFREHLPEEKPAVEEQPTLPPAPTATRKPKWPKLAVLVGAGAFVVGVVGAVIRWLVVT